MPRRNESRRKGGDRLTETNRPFRGKKRNVAACSPNLYEGCEEASKLELVKFGKDSGNGWCILRGSLRQAERSGKDPRHGKIVGAGKKKDP